MNKPIDFDVYCSECGEALNIAKLEFDKDVLVTIYIEKCKCKESYMTKTEIESIKLNAKKVKSKWSREGHHNRIGFNAYSLFYDLMDMCDDVIELVEHVKVLEKVI